LNIISYIKDLTFADKDYFWLMLILPVLILWYIFRLKRNEAELNFSSLEQLGPVKTSYKAVLRHVVFVLRLICIALVITVLARPQSRSSWKDIKTEGIDIVLSIDISYSMLAKDFNPNRLDAAKEVAKEFIDARPNDCIGLVVFGGEAFTQCPLTTDHAVIKNLFKDVNAGMLAQGTAIGMGIADAVARVKDSKAKSRVVILLSDGVNNAGDIAPATAGEIAKTFGVRVYTIGVGTKGKALTPVGMYPNGQFAYDYVDVEIDEPLMQKIAAETGGKYFRATDKASLRRVYKEIDKMEKSIISEKNFSDKEEHFFPFALAAAIALLLEFIIKHLIINPAT
jgi:Ca-activated chloride channel family protein